MKFVIQRVTEASVRVNGEIIGEIGTGFCVLIGVGGDDDELIADKMIKKMLGLRIFEDENGKTNLSLKSVGGSLLLISQFTLYADCRKGNRPSFVNAGEPEKANSLYEYIIGRCRDELGGWEAEEASKNNLHENIDIASGYDKDDDNVIAAKRYAVETGSFGADMKVSLINDGPFTVILNSDELS